MATKAANAKQYKRREELGLCHSCPNPRPADAIRCADCAAKNRTEVAARGEQSRINGQCVKGCGRSVLPGKARCATCMGKQRVANRRCYNERAQRGQCVYCMSGATVGLFCFGHWFKNVGVAHGLGSKKGQALLRQLWDEQKGRCAITGEVMVPGSTASIDHIIPKSRGGSNEKSNLQWVLLNINRSKWDMTHDEFVAVCRSVVREQDRRAKAVNELSMRSN